MPITQLQMAQTAYLFKSGVSPSRKIVLIVMDGTDPIPLIEVAY